MILYGLNVQPIFIAARLSSAWTPHAQAQPLYDQILNKINNPKPKVHT